VGRDDELRLLKDFFHATSRERRARLISVTGQGGIGKSRLAWEFLKYVDGVLETVYWHQGRSPAYGEGITFWALGEMVRRRAGLAEGDDEAGTRAGIAKTLAEFVSDDAERRWLEPALLFLLGFGDAPTGGRDDLFAAWRTFFERIADQATALLVFEDLQWADSGLLDFIDHLLEWSTNHPIYVVTLARPELLERRPDWGAGRRNFVALSLPPLSEPAMRELLAGLVPGLPVPTVRAILERADGIPLYAVETVRMLVAEGRLELVDGAYRPTSDLTGLAVPDSLHALIAARLDALDPADRSLLQDGAVLGQTFPVAALAAVSGIAPELLEPRLRSLARREILILDTDPRSPERGQYGFTQALIREVAYATLSKKERRARHLAAARYFESLGDEEVGVLATHYVDAYLASPEGPEAASVAAQARISLRAAADRASALGSHEQAVAYLTRAIDVTPDAGEKAELLERVGAEQHVGGRLAAGETTLRQAAAAHGAEGDRLAEIRASVALAEVLNSQFKSDDALAVLTPLADAASVLGDEVLSVRLNGQLARAHMFAEDFSAAIEWSDRTLVAAERLGLVREIADTMITKGIAYGGVGRLRESIGLLEAAERLAASAGLVMTVLRAQINLTGALSIIDPRASVQVAQQGSEVARRLGLAHAMTILVGNGAESALPTGDLGWAFRAVDDLLGLDLDDTDRGAISGIAVGLRALRGLPYADQLGDLERVVTAMPAHRVNLGLARIWIAAAEGDIRTLAREAVHVAEASAGNAAVSLSTGARSAVLAKDAALVRDFLDRLAVTGLRGPTLDAQRRTAEAGLAALEGRWADAVALYQEGTRLLRDLGLDFDLGLLWLGVLASAPDSDPLVVTAEREARAIFERIGSPPYLAQLERLLAERADPAPPARVAPRRADVPAPDPTSPA
jgi:tetratricopeptide (TPR) repeat protein